MSLHIDDKLRVSTVEKTEQLYLYFIIFQSGGSVRQIKTAGPANSVRNALSKGQVFRTSTWSKYLSVF